MERSGVYGSSPESGWAYDCFKRYSTMEVMRRDFGG